MAHWLVTGGVGFIGYHTARALLARGDRVTILDDFSDAPYPRAEKERNERDLFAEFSSSPPRVVRGGITDRAVTGPLVTGVDGVLHLAGLAGVRPSFENPSHYARVNVEGTALLAELVRDRGVPRFVFASSSSVYGDSTPLPAQEDAEATVPASPYAASKRGAELVVASLFRDNPRITATALRFFTVYGPRQRPEMAITLFTRALLRGEAIPLFGDGSMRRDFTHVADIVRGLLASSERANGGYRVYNLGSGAPIDLGALVAALGTATGTTPSVERRQIPRGDVAATYADIARARNELGWSPQVELTEGIQTVVAWVRKRELERGQ